MAVVEHGEASVFRDAIVPQPVELSQASWEWQPGKQELCKRNQVPACVAAAAQAHAARPGRPSVAPAASLLNRRL